ncbi:MAG TPA: hypothetical protein DCY00_08650 [Actinobacteria bacterium]|nr:hypothetical protein [Actinomycetota bacterium]
MRIKVFFVFILISLMFYAGCASGPGIKKINKEIEGYELPEKPAENKAMVYVVRPGSTGFLIKFGVYINEKNSGNKVGSTGANEYINFELDPAEYIIMSQAENLAKYILQAEKNKTYFLKQISRTGLLFSRNKLVKISENEGMYWVKQLNKVLIKE